MGLERYTIGMLESEVRRRDQNAGERERSREERQDSSRRCPMCSQCDWGDNCPVLEKK